MIKKYQINNNIIILNISDGYCSKHINIQKGFLNGKNLEKKVSMSIWDDMSFSAYSPEDDINEIVCEIEKDDLIYFALNRMLGVDDSLIIDDDGTSEELIKYVEFKKDKDKILIIFHDEEDSKGTYSERFNVFIKNVGPDPRSKIEDFNIKYRLHKFFQEAQEILLNEYHQYSLDEYFELFKDINNFKGSNPFFIQNNKLFKNACASCFICKRECENKGKLIDNWCSNYLSGKENYYQEKLKQKKMVKKTREI